MGQAQKLTELQLQRLAVIAVAMEKAGITKVKAAPLRDLMELDKKNTQTFAVLTQASLFNVMKKDALGFFSFIPAGKKTLAPLMEEARGAAPNDIFAVTSYNKKGAAKPATATEENAVAGIVGLIDENKRLRGLLSRFQIEIGNALTGE